MLKSKKEERLQKGVLFCKLVCFDILYIHKSIISKMNVYSTFKIEIYSKY